MINKLENLCVYLGSKCNFNCSYCDRDYIETSIGNQFMTTADLPAIYKFLDYYINELDQLKILSFHGGEAFMYINVMNKIMEYVDSNGLIDNFNSLFIQTNGSLILNDKSKDFIRKWGSKLHISISYDMINQDHNRTHYDLEKVLKFLKENDVGIQVQIVIPMDNLKFFDYENIFEMIRLYRTYNISHYSLIVLRHIRGKDRFRVLVDEYSPDDIKTFFLHYMNMLYTFNIYNVHYVIDGNYDNNLDNQKNYFNYHKQLILSPDGYLYPEFDFLDYQLENYRVGQWRDKIDIDRNREFIAKCIDCDMNKLCGLKYLHTIFDTKPETDNCKVFYANLKLTALTAQKAYRSKHLFNLVQI